MHRSLNRLRLALLSGIIVLPIIACSDSSPPAAAPAPTSAPQGGPPSKKDMGSLPEIKNDAPVNK